MPLPSPTRRQHILLQRLHQFQKAKLQRLPTGNPASLKAWWKNRGKSTFPLFCSNNARAFHGRGALHHRKPGEKNRGNSMFSLFCKRCQGPHRKPCVTESPVKNRGNPMFPVFCKRCRDPHRKPCITESPVKNRGNPMFPLCFKRCRGFPREALRHRKPGEKKRELHVPFVLQTMPGPS